MVRHIFIRSLMIAAAIGLAGGLWVTLHSYAEIHASMQSHGEHIYARVEASGSERARAEASQMLRFAEEPRSFFEVMRQSMSYGSFWAVFLPLFVALFVVAFLIVYLTLVWRQRHRLLDEDEA